MKESLDIEQATFKVRKGKGYLHFKILHNLPAHSFAQMKTSSFLCWGVVSGCLGPKVGQALSPCIKAGLAEWESQQYPVGKEEQQAWVLACLKHSTRGFSNPGVAAKVSDEVQKRLNTTICGKESRHLLHVMEFCDFRGSEVSLRDGTVSEGNRQVIPYPAMVWAWRSVQAYTWQQPQHMNILELVAFFDYARACVRDPGSHSNRVFMFLILGWQAA